MRRRGALIGGMAAGGVLLTHLLTFFVEAPDGHQRAELLQRTGHFSYTLVAAAVLGLVVSAAVRLLPLHRRHPMAQLLAVQSVAWVGLESIERLAHEGAHWELGLIALGLSVQALVAALACLLLKAVGHVVAAIAGRRRRTEPRRAPAVARLFLRVDTLARPAVLAGAAGVRGPPYHS